MTLIERLRKGIVTSAPYEPQYTVPPVKICFEAADEIERLTAELTTSRYWREQEVKDLTAELAEMKAERDSLSVAAALWNHRYIDACQQHADRQTNLGHQIVALEAELARAKEGEQL